MRASRFAQSEIRTSSGLAPVADLCVRVWQIEIETNRSSLLPIAVIASLVGLCLAAPGFLQIYRQHRATRAWLGEARPACVPSLNRAPSWRSSEFLGMMRAYRLEEGDPVERFIAVFGEPHRVTDAPLFGKGVQVLHVEEGLLLLASTQRNPAGAAVASEHRIP